MDPRLQTSQLPLDLDPQFMLVLTYQQAWQGFPGGSDGKESACNAGD